MDSSRGRSCGRRAGSAPGSGERSASTARRNTDCHGFHASSRYVFSQAVGEYANSPTPGLLLSGVDLTLSAGGGEHEFDLSGLADESDWIVTHATLSWTIDITADWEDGFGTKSMLIETEEWSAFLVPEPTPLMVLAVSTLLLRRPWREQHGGIIPNRTYRSGIWQERLLRADLRVPEQNEIEHVDGRWGIHTQGTLAFLHKHLNRPKSDTARED